MLNFSIHDNRIWMRNYQIILEGENKVKEDKFKPEVVEIGPRIVLNLQRIQEGPFSGQAIYLNPGTFITVYRHNVIFYYFNILDYVGPNERRRANTLGRKDKSYFNKVVAKEHKEKMKAEVPEAPKHVTDDIFVNN